jgi:hypothetical protein
LGRRSVLVLQGSWRREALVGYWWAGVIVRVEEKRLEACIVKTAGREMVLE